MSVPQLLQLIQFEQKIREKQSSHNKILILLQGNTDITFKYKIKARVCWRAQMEHKYFAHCCFSLGIRQNFSREVRAVGYAKTDKGLLAVPFQKKNCSTSLCWLITFFDFHRKLWCLDVCFACLQIHWLLAYVKSITHSSGLDFQASIFLVLKKSISYLKATYLFTTISGWIPVPELIICYTPASGRAVMGHSRAIENFHSNGSSHYFTIQNSWLWVLKLCFLFSEMPLQALTL